MSGLRPRAREIGLHLGRLPPGPLNAITDVQGVSVGHVSLIAGEDVRTGVTAILPHERDPFEDQVQAAAFVLNGEPGVRIPLVVSWTVAAAALLAVAGAGLLLWSRFKKPGRKA